ncbi:uncharacterized protein LOC127257046 isoform X3 [Andrographis paniculata]|nr:uncharacterized protein LOC127257046 isoform X3 [Andrographis paniculata]XP_051139274.1 uncharacterized protein LOC127257046 isoform X3 [Andrographis paniculata]
MKTLRSQINDVADQAAKISVEEHMQSTTIRTLQKDIDLVNKETQQVKEETVKMFKAKEQICSQILEKQRKFTSLESDSFTRSQILELVQQESLTLAQKLVDQSLFHFCASAYYKKVDEDINEQLKQHQEWIKTHNFDSNIRENQVSEKTGEIKDFHGNVSNDMMRDIQAVQGKFDKTEQLKSNFVMENAKLRQCIEQVKTKMSGIKLQPELRDIDDLNLEEELHAALSDKAGEYEYMQSLPTQIMRFKEISNRFRCSCDNE